MRIDSKRSIVTLLFLTIFKIFIIFTFSIFIGILIVVLVFFKIEKGKRCYRVGVFLFWDGEV